MANYNTTVTLITHNQENIAFEINKISTDMNKFVFDFNNYMEVRNILDQLNLTLQTILQLLTDLETAITFARLNIIHSSLINPEELKWAVEKMHEHHSSEQLAYVQEDFTKYFNILRVDGYYTNHTLVFVIHFPVFYPDPFSYFHLFSTPTYNQTIIIPPGPYLASNENLYQYMETPCEPMGIEYLCVEQLLQESYDCVNEILKLTNEEARCEHLPISINSTFIQEMSEAHYIAVFPQATKISTQCSSSKIMVLQGTYLIELPPGCRFRTNTEAFENTKSVIREEALTLPRIKTSSQTQIAKTKPLTIKKIPLDQLHLLTREEERLQSISTNQPKTDPTHFWMTPIYIIITICIILGLYKLRGRQRKTPEEPEVHQDVPSSPSSPSVLFVPYKTSSGDGEVTVR